MLSAVWSISHQPSGRLALLNTDSLTCRQRQTSRSNNWRGTPILLQLAAKAGVGDGGDDVGELEVSLWLGLKYHVLGRISEDHASEPDGFPLLLRDAMVSNPFQA